jgi:hypothetical protein
MATKAQKVTEAERLKAALAGASKECTGDTEKRCQGMTFALFHQGERGVGIEVMPTLNLKTGEDVGMGFVYRTPKGSKTLFLRFCPWCGVEVHAPPAARGAPAESEGR